MPAILTNAGPPGNVLSDITEYLDDRKWLFFERGLMVVWTELKTMSGVSWDPQQAMIDSVVGRYNYKGGSVVVQPPVLSRSGVPGTSTPIWGY